MTANTGRYRKVSTPHENKAVAAEQLEKFIAVVEAAREEYRIPEIVAFVAMNVIDDNGVEVQLCADFQYGNEGGWPMLAGRLYAVVSERMKQALARAMKGEAR